MKAVSTRRITIPELAARVGCTRAVLHKYRNGKSRTIEALLLFEIADALAVSARWLLTGDGAMDRGDSLQGAVTAFESIRNIVEATPKPRQDHAN